MHSAVLQNKKYIEFAGDNTVEVLALGRLDEGISKGDPKAATYKGKDADGNEIEYMLSWPGLTKDQINTLRSGKAGTFNDTGGIPYTSLINPHTGEKMRGYSGGQSSKQMMGNIEAIKAELNKKYGPSLKRSDLAKYEVGAKDAADLLKSKGAGKAMPKVVALMKKWAKKSATLAARSKALKEQVLETAGEELDTAEEKIGEQDMKSAKKILAGLKSALRKSSLEARWKQLYAKTKVESK